VVGVGFYSPYQVMLDANVGRGRSGDFL